MKDKNKKIKEYLRLHYATQDTNKIAERFNTTADNIRHIAKRIGIKKKFANDIINDKKLCSTCKRLLPISEFHKDKYQKNNLRYDCIKCFNIRNNKNKHKVSHYSSASSTTLHCHNDRKREVDCCHYDSIDKLDRKRNPIVYKDNVAGLNCKVCYEWKPLSEFYKNKKMDSGHLNSCKVCEKERRKNKKVS